MQRKYSARLARWHEATGLLERIERRDDRLVIKLSYHLFLELPLHLYEDLETKIGKRIGILRTNRDLRVRLLPDDSEEKSEIEEVKRP